MTPEEIQRTMDFILESQSNSNARMDRLEQNMDRLQQNMDQLELDLKRQSETVEGLLRVSQALLTVSANIVDRTKRLESRADSTDETLRVIRELLESNLKPPDKPKE
jgi:hypothetical protein